jgi:hypothetical protein
LQPMQRTGSYSIAMASGVGCFTAAARTGAGNTVAAPAAVSACNALLLVIAIEPSPVPRDLPPRSLYRSGRPAAVFRSSPPAQSSPAFLSWRTTPANSRPPHPLPGSPLPVTMQWGCDCRRCAATTRMREQSLDTQHHEGEYHENCDSHRDLRAVASFLRTSGPAGPAPLAIGGCQWGRPEEGHLCLCSVGSDSVCRTGSINNYYVEIILPELIITARIFFARFRAVAADEEISINHRAHRAHRGRVCQGCAISARPQTTAMLLLFKQIRKHGRTAKPAGADAPGRAQTSVYSGCSVVRIAVGSAREPGRTKRTRASDSLGPAFGGGSSVAADREWPAVEPDSGRLGQVERLGAADGELQVVHHGVDTDERCVLLLGQDIQLI